MKSLFTSTYNTRFTLPGSCRYLRSDVPDRITEEERNWLLAQNVRTIVDLRSSAERTRRPCPLETDDRFCYHHLPVTGGDCIPASPEAVGESYIAMADERMTEIIRLIQNASTNVLYFCNAGKDRTGVVSAILQKDAGLPEAFILDDYVASGENLKDKLEAFAKSNPAIDLRVITPNRAYMKHFLAWYERK